MTVNRTHIPKAKRKKSGRKCKYPSCGKDTWPNWFFCPKHHEVVDREPWDDDTYSGFSAHGHLRAMGAY